MAQPRKAMKSLGFQGCCLRCDAEDVSGLSRCKSCIEYHTSVKNMLIGNDDSLLIQHMKELYVMLSKPEMFDVDEVHGKELIYQQSLISTVEFDEGFVYPEDISDLYTKKEVEEIIGCGAFFPTMLFPLPKEGYKWCACCFQELPLNEFHDNIDKNGNKIKRSSCKCCKLDQDKKRRKKNKTQ